jgi:hypothetical protein
MSSFGVDGSETGIKTENFSFGLINDLRVNGNLMIMDQSCYIWLTSQDGECVMGSLATAMPTRFSGMPISTTLIPAEDDFSSEMAQRLAFRFKIQVFISCNLPPSYESHIHHIDKQIIDLLNPHFKV